MKAIGGNGAPTCSAAWSLRPLPWTSKHTGSHLRRPFVIVAPDLERAICLHPRRELPILRSGSARSAIELPVLLPSEADAHDEVQLELTFSDGSRERVYLSAGNLACRRPIAETDSTGVPHSDDETTTICVDSILNTHSEALGECIYPSRPGHRRPQRVGGLAPLDWKRISDALWAADDDDQGRLDLIVQIEQECRELLGRICATPRKLLRRERTLTELGRIEQFDEVCVRWFARQPGRSVLEKAGPRQRLLAVQRSHTCDTLENRVVRDFLERATTACDEYLASHRHRPRTPRIRAVERFRLSLGVWLKTSEIGEVPLPIASPQANYVLQFDDRYGRIWPWYERLRRQQEDAAELWRWQHRVWAEHCVLAVANVVLALDGELAFRGRAYLRTRPRFGEFLSTQSAFDVGHASWQGAPALRWLHPYRDVPTVPSESAISELADLFPDAILRHSGRFGRSAREPIIGIWTLLSPVDSRAQLDQLEEARASLVAAIRASGGPDSLGLLLVPTTQGRVQALPRNEESQVLALTVPAGSGLAMSAIADSILLWLQWISGEI